MNTQQIVMGVNARVAAIGNPYNSWKIGLSHNTAERRRYWQDTRLENIDGWTQWTADSLAEAQAVENYFTKEKGMISGPAVDLYENKTVYVYIF